MRDLVREQHARGRPREAGEGQPGDERDAQDAGHRLDHDHDVGVAGGRVHPAVADGRDGLHAEVERVLERPRPGVGDRVPAAAR